MVDFEKFLTVCKVILQDLSLYVKFLNAIDDTASRGDVFQCKYPEITDSILKLYKKFGEYLMFVCSKLKQMLNYSDAVEILRQEQYESKLQFNTSFQTRQAERYP